MSATVSWGHPSHERVGASRGEEWLDEMTGRYTDGLEPLSSGIRHDNEVHSKAHGGHLNTIERFVVDGPSHVLNTQQEVLFVGVSARRLCYDGGQSDDCLSRE